MDGGRMIGGETERKNGESKVGGSWAIAGR